MIRLTEANNGTEVHVSVASITSVREYPAGQTQVSTSEPSLGVIQVKESVEEVNRLIEEEGK